MRIFPEMWANTLWPFSSSTLNMALGRGSITVPSRTIASSLGLGRADLRRLTGTVGWARASATRHKAEEGCYWTVPTRPTSPGCGGGFAPRARSYSWSVAEGDVIWAQRWHAIVPLLVAIPVAVGVAITLGHILTTRYPDLGWAQTVANDGRALAVGAPLYGPPREQYTG